MKFLGVIVFASALGAVMGAALLPGRQPQEESLANQIQEYEQYIRNTRSSYPGAYYAPAPCGAAPIPVPAYHIPHAPHHAPAYAPAIPHYGYPAYRDADEAEMMNFSDFDQEQAMSQQAMFEQPSFGHVPMARYAYGPAAAIPAPAYGGASAASAAAALAGLSGAPAVPAGPAIGVFPNANVGGCAVPLLLSCSPSIRPGHIVKSHAYGGYGAVGGEAYRGVDAAHDSHDDAAHDQLAPAHDAASSLPVHQ